MDVKLGGGAHVERYFRQRVQGLKLAPVSRPPRALPAGAGAVYFQVERDALLWRDVVATHTLGLRMNLARASFRSDRILAVAMPGGEKTTNIQMSLLVV